MTAIVGSFVVGSCGDDVFIEEEVVGETAGVVVVVGDNVTLGPSSTVLGTTVGTFVVVLLGPVGARVTLSSLMVDAAVYSGIV